MKKFVFNCLFLSSLLCLASCGGESGAGDSDSTSDAKEPNVTRVVKSEGFDRQQAFVVISKRDQYLRVYAPVNGDTTLLAHFPVCLSKNKGNKEKSGDMRTPESPKGQPFEITKIEDASTWTHDFNDGRGPIKAYGNWFLRLKTPGHSGIGIHGSTNNENTVPGRASEGCIRLLDKDIDMLKETYAFVGMKVIIKAEDEGPLSFEK